MKKTEIEPISEEKKPSLTAYPNPFVTNTRIDYSLPDGGQYSLVLYNSVGVRIAVLKESKGEAGKRDTYNLNGTSLKTGVYYVKLETARSMKTIKIIRRE